MKAVISKEAVADAIKQLNDKGQKPTLAAIHAALGGKGSLTTLIKIKAELEQAATAPQDSAEGLNQFRALWAAAVTEGRKEMEGQAAELRAGLDALSVENERLEAAAIADAARVAEIMGQRDKLVDELSQANKAATEARAAGADAANRLAAALGEIAQIRAEYLQAVTTAARDLASARDLAHSAQIERATLAAQLEAERNAHAKTSARVDDVRADLDQMKAENRDLQEQLDAKKRENEKNERRNEELWKELEALKNKPKRRT